MSKIDYGYEKAAAISQRADATKKAQSTSYAPATERQIRDEALKNLDRRRQVLIALKNHLKKMLQTDSSVDPNSMRRLQSGVEAAIDRVNYDRRVVSARLDMGKDLSLNPKLTREEKRVIKTNVKLMNSAYKSYNRKIDNLNKKSLVNDNALGYEGQVDKIVDDVIRLKKLNENEMAEVFDHAIHRHASYVY